MCFDREPWDSPAFSVGASPGWDCPSCGQASVLVGEINSEETVASKEAFDDPDWEPDWIEKRFVIFLECSACKDRLVACGRAGVEPEQFSLDYNDVYRPVYVYPAPDMFRIAPGLPPEFVRALRESFALYWGDPSAAGNRVRTAVELLMDHYGVRSKAETKKGEARFLSLGERIAEFRESSDDNRLLADSLNAIRWLGNMGTHSAGLKRSDLLNAYEMIAHATPHITGDARRIEQLQKEILDNKGPARRDDAT